MQLKADLDRLKRQKLTIVKLLDRGVLTGEEDDALGGILNMLDGIQDGLTDYGYVEISRSEDS